MDQAGQALPPGSDELDVAAWLELPSAERVLEGCLRSALRQARTARELGEARRQLEQRTAQMREVHHIGIALSSEHDMLRLQHLILSTALDLTNADAGTLYLIEENAEKQKILVFHIAQNNSIEAPYQQMIVPLDHSSLAGHVACSAQPLCVDDVYQLPEMPCTFDPGFDEQFGYRSRSMLIVPMLTYRGAVVGVIQLINRKRNRDAILRDRAAVDHDVVPFRVEDRELVASLASQAAVALENKQLLDTVLQREQRLQQEVIELSIVIDMAREEREVAEITNTDYFQQLQSRASALRSRLNAAPSR